MSSVSGVSSSLYSIYSDSTASRKKGLDTSSMAEELFSKLDTSGKGYIEASDLESALSGLSSTSSTSGTTSASEIFSQLDSDSDGKVTQDELTSSLNKLAESLNSQFDQMRMQGAMPPPPPPSDSDSESDTGFTKDQLTSQLTDIGSTDTKRSSLISTIVENFDAADTNSDGKVSNAEAMAYDQSTSSSTESTTASADTAEAQVFQQLMALLHTYDDGTASSNTLSSLISTSA